MSQLATWIIFGVILVFLVAFLIFSFVRDKRKNEKIVEKRIELKRATVRTSKEIAIRIYTLYELNEKFLKEVVPGRSKIKMKNVTHTARIFLKDIYDSKAFKVIYIESGEADEQYAKNMKILIERNSNLWNKYCQEQISYFKKLHDDLKHDDNFKKMKDEAKKNIEELFKEQVKA